MHENDFYMEDYINDLYRKQNEGATLEQKGLYTKKDYYKLLKPVMELIKDHKDYTIEELRNLLYKNSHIEESIKDFVYNKRMTPGMVLSYGTMNYKETLVVGNRKEDSLRSSLLFDQKGHYIPDVREMTRGTIFDLASVTKIFTSISILKLAQLGMLDLNDEIIKYEPRFIHLKGVTIFDLLSFRVPLRTDGRIDDALSQEEAENIVFTMHRDENFKYGRNPYTDMGAISLKYVIEKVTGMEYYTFLKQNILSKFEMNDTYACVPPSKRNRLASTNLETKIMADGAMSHSTVKEGLVHDPKALALGQKEGKLSGHAGLFSTAGDMTKFSKAIINREILNKEYLESLAKNRTGEKYIEDGKEKYIQYLAFLCYSKNPVLENSELFHALSGKSFASAGYTGTQLTVDPVNELYLFLGANRTHNRVSVVAPSQREKINYKKNGMGTFPIPFMGDIVSYRFAWDRDKYIIHPALQLTLQYKMLEDILALTNEKTTEKVRKIGKNSR